MYKTIIVSIIWLLISLFTTTATARENFDATASLGWLTGDSTYEIGNLFCVSINGALDGCGRDNFPLSRLEFPLDQMMADVGIRFTTGIDSVYFHVEKNISTTSGKMRDSDWTTADPNLRTIYSESSSSIEATIYKFGWERMLTSRMFGMNVFMGVDLTLQNFYFKAGNTDQVSIDPIACTCFIPGPTITYDVNYVIPSILFRLKEPGNPKSSLSYTVFASPLVSVDDEDQHLARANAVDSIKISNGDLDGNMYGFELAYHIALNPAFKLNFFYKMLHIDTKGTQHQSQFVDLNNPPDGIAEFLQVDIHEEVHSDQKTMGASVTATF